MLYVLLLQVVVYARVGAGIGCEVSMVLSLRVVSIFVVSLVNLCVRG